MSCQCLAYADDSRERNSARVRPIQRSRYHFRPIFGHGYCGTRCRCLQPGLKRFFWNRDKPRKVIKKRRQ